MKIKNLRKKLLVSMLLVLLVMTLAVTLAFWAGSLSGATVADGGNVTIGTGEAVTTEVSLSSTTSSGVLVPAGRADDSVEPNAVESITITFTVAWLDTVDNDSYDSYTGNLVVSTSNVKINDDTTNAGLVSLVVTAPSTISLNSSAVTVTVVVTLAEPSTQAQYAAVAGKDITFDVTFTVTI